MAKQNLTVSSVCDESILLPRKILDLITTLIIIIVLVGVIYVNKDKFIEIYKQIIKV